ncbi:uncharacterized protein LOC129597405 [Paramacrobiotus metropolitanus]|uniref:uncharacterized protein LOC129597405 n=1 Tax=Paramacrobiotus metropolitanus TaxID=2943436 RepID=UPI0024460A7E|nr:uncharacterized protein LOC129597405 [Paramacrobiotus metropolitanus]
MMKALSVIISSCLLALVAAFSVDIVTLGNINLQTLGSLPLSGPAIDLAVEELRTVYKDVFTVSHAYLYDRQAKTCEEVASVADDLVAGFYYRKNTTSDLTVFISVGCTEQEQIARLSYEWNLAVIYGSTTAVSSRKRNTYPQMILAGPGSGFPYMIFGLNVAQLFKWTMIYIAYQAPGLPIYQDAATNLALTLRRGKANQIRVGVVDCTTMQTTREFLEDFRANARS